MKLSDYDVLPGIVINVEDPKHIGRIKATVPTWFDTSVISEEALPWIYPGPMGGYQRFSKLENGRKVWVFHNRENYEEYWYLPMFELNDDTKNIIEGYDSSEVLLSRTTGSSGSVFIYYNDSDGIVMKIGQTEINISTNDEIHITDGTSSINIVGGNINIGKESNQEQAVMGETLQKTLQKLGGSLTTIGSGMSSLPFVSPLAPDMIKAGSELQADCANILSNTVKISK